MRFYVCICVCIYILQVCVQLMHQFQLLLRRFCVFVLVSQLISVSAIGFYLYSFEVCVDINISNWVFSCVVLQSLLVYVLDFCLRFFYLETDLMWKDM